MNALADASRVLEERIFLAAYCVLDERDHDIFNRQLCLALIYCVKSICYIELNRFYFKKTLDGAL